jgi:hypothetical protein
MEIYNIDYYVLVACCRFEVCVPRYICSPHKLRKLDQHKLNHLDAIKKNLSLFS